MNQIITDNIQIITPNILNFMWEELEDHLDVYKETMRSYRIALSRYKTWRNVLLFCKDFGCLPYFGNFLSSFKNSPWLYNYIVQLVNTISIFYRVSLFIEVAK